MQAFETIEQAFAERHVEHVDERRDQRTNGEHFGQRAVVDLLLEIRVEDAPDGQRRLSGRYGQEVVLIVDEIAIVDEQLDEIRRKLQPFHLIGVETTSETLAGLVLCNGRRREIVRGIDDDGLDFLLLRRRRRRLATGVGVPFEFLRLGFGQIVVGNARVGGVRDQFARGGAAATAASRVAPAGQRGRFFHGKVIGRRLVDDRVDVRARRVVRDRPAARSFRRARAVVLAQILQASLALAVLNEQGSLLLPAVLVHFHQACLVHPFVPLRTPAAVVHQVERAMEVAAVVLLHLVIDAFDFVEQQAVVAEHDLVLAKTILGRRELVVDLKHVDDWLAGLTLVVDEVFVVVVVVFVAVVLLFAVYFIDHFVFI